MRKINIQPLSEIVQKAIEEEKTSETLDITKTPTEITVRSKKDTGMGGVKQVPVATVNFTNDYTEVIVTPLYRSYETLMQNIAEKIESKSEQEVIYITPIEKEYNSNPSTGTRFL